MILFERLDEVCHLTELLNLWWTIHLNCVFLLVEQILIEFLVLYLRLQIFVEGHSLVVYEALVVDGGILNQRSGLE